MSHPIEDDDLPLNNPSVLKKFIDESRLPTFIDKINELISDDFDDIDVKNGNAFDVRPSEKYASNNTLLKNEDFRDYISGAVELS